MSPFPRYFSLWRRHGKSKTIRHWNAWPKPWFKLSYLNNIWILSDFFDSSSFSFDLKNMYMNFSDFSDAFFYTWPSNDLEPRRVKANWFRCQTYWPQKNKYEFFQIFLTVFPIYDLHMTLNLAYSRLTDLGFELSHLKKICMHFSDFSDAFFYTWPSNDLEPDVMEVNWPSHRNQRPQEPLYIQSVSGVPE